MWFPWNINSTSRNNWRFLTQKNHSNSNELKWIKIDFYFQSHFTIFKTIIKHNKKWVPKLWSTSSRHPYQPRSIIRGQVFVAPLPASRGTLFLTIPIHSPSGKCTVMHEDMGWGSLRRPCFPKLQFPFLCSHTSWLQMFVTHPNNYRFLILLLAICNFVDNYYGFIIQHWVLLPFCIIWELVFESKWKLMNEKDER